MTFGFIARQWKPISTLYYSGLAFWAHLQKSKKKVTTSFILSVCLHKTSQLPQVGVSWNLIFEYFSKICQENSSFIKIWQEKWGLHSKTNICLWSHLAQFFLEWEMVQTKVIEKDKTLTYILTYSMEHSPSWEANWSAASQEIPRILWNLKVHHRTHKRTPPVPILS